MKLLVNAMILLLGLCAGETDHGETSESKSRQLGFQLYNPFKVKHVGGMEVGDYVRRGEGLAASDPNSNEGAKVEIGLEEQGYVALFNPDPVQRWMSRVGAGHELKNDKERGFVLLSKANKVLMTLFKNECGGDMKVKLHADGFVSFVIDDNDYMVGYLDGSGYAVHLGCPPTKESGKRKMLRQ